MAVEEAPNFFRFMAETDGIGNVRAHTVEIHPGMKKIMVKEGFLSARVNLSYEGIFPNNF
ncbi:hypothetical protein JHK86_042987 [Glycine max]|nr:hypothetical protein JHK86_042987 [Glycine max]